MEIITKQQLHPILIQKGYIKPQMSNKEKERVLDFWFAIVQQSNDKHPPLICKVANRKILGRVLRRKKNVVKKTAK